MEIQDKTISIAPMLKLTKDALRAFQGAALPAGGPAVEDDGSGFWSTGGGGDAKQLIDLYYRVQELRKRLDNQGKAMDCGADTGSHHVVDFLAAQASLFEDNARAFLLAFAGAHAMWPWLSAVHGIGPVLASGLIAHLKLTPTVGHWWRFAGLDPHQQWLPKDEISALLDKQEGDLDLRVRQVAIIVGRNPDTAIRDATTDHRTGESKALTRASAVSALARIPFNRPLKTLCWKIGDSFVKLGDRKDAFYSVYYRNRKASEIVRNERGDRAELAARTLLEKPRHAQRAIYAQGKLPDGRIDLMARRATVKLFLSHMHEVWYRLEHGTLPPAPFAIAIKGHAHYIPPPHLDSVGLFPLKAA
jgi:hypothetical protein